MGEYLNYHLHHKVEPLLKIMLPLLDRFWGKEYHHQRRSRGKGECSLWNKKPPEVCARPPLSVSVEGEALMLSRGSLAPAAGPGLDFGPLSLFHKCLRAVFVLFPLNKHYMVATNTSLGEGQGSKTEENHFHKNIKNRKKLLFKKFAIQTKWQLLKILIKLE
uniref:Uncharacterized protein n=1 Tax=Molossus molossus TaxID=27622 RepID=A0A7J8E2T4_MOLMO|nr:hypothetical protein HJG59_009043 [Molossus molossus]